MVLALERNMLLWYRLFCLVLPKDGLFWPSAFDFNMFPFYFCVACLLFLFLNVFLTLTALQSVFLPAAAVPILTICCMFFFLSQRTSVTFLPFTWCPIAASLPSRLPGLCCCLLSPVSCLCPASASLPLYQLHVRWVSAHPVLLQVTPDFTLLFHPFFFSLDFA